MYFGVMNTFDIIVLIIFCYGAIRGLVKGFIIELAGIIGLFLAFYGAYQFANVVKNLIIKYISWDPKLLFTISFLILFIGILIGVSFLAKLITKTMKIVALGWLNRLAGGLFGVFKWSLIISALIIVAQEVNSIFTLLPDSFTKDSFSFPLLNEIGNQLINLEQLYPMENLTKII